MNAPIHLRQLRQLLFAVVLGILSIGPESILAEQNSSTSNKTPTTTPADSDKEQPSANSQPISNADTGANETADTESSIATDKEKEDKKPKKKDGCRPGSLALMGVGC